MSRPALRLDERRGLMHAECAPAITWADYMRVWTVHPDEDVDAAAPCALCGQPLGEEPGAEDTGIGTTL